MAYLQKEQGPNGEKYFVYSTHKHYIEFLKILTATNSIKVSTQTMNIQSGTKENSNYRPYITAIKSKPFLLLAGISGTGKSRIVRELARACWEEDSEEYKAQKPRNFEMVQVKPNWHDSSELIGYVSRVSGKAEFVVGDFLKFVAKAWEDQDTPYFLCLDEMNLAPVEQYFAEYLSVVESRKCGEDGGVTTDPILKKEDAEWYFNLTAEITSDDKVRTRFNEDGISIPQNLIVVGTVNMDEMTKFHYLDAIISVGYRINSIRATQFRQWYTYVILQITPFSAYLLCMMRQYRQSKKAPCIEWFNKENPYLYVKSF